MRIRRVGVGIAVAAALLGCGGQEPAGEDEPAAEAPDGEAADEGDDAPADGDGSGGAAGLDEATDRAVADAAQSAGVDPGQVEVVTAERVTWPDGSLGCPEGGESYTQALVEGYRVVLEVDGERQHYHGQEGDAPFRCEDPQEPVSS